MMRPFGDSLPMSGPQGNQIDQGFNVVNLILQKISVAAVMIALAGCVAPSQQPPMTAEQQAMALEMQKAFLARLQGASPATTQPVAPSAELPKISNDELLKKLKAFEGQTTPIQIERYKDGILIGGKPYVDAEGTIANAAANTQTGDIGYILRLPDNTAKIKYMRAGSNAPAVTLATARHQNNTWAVQTVTGDNSAGDRLIPSSKGLIVARQSSAFEFVPGMGFKSISAPAGFHLAAFQNGDIASTGYVLLERDAKESENQVDQLMGLAKSLKKTVGLEKKDDYMLMNINTGQTVTFDKGTEDNKTAVGGSNCKMQSETLNVVKCETLDIRDSLYESNGSRNDEHYFWSLFWFQTSEGPFAIAKEAGTRKVTMTELSTGKKVVLFERALGIANFAADQSTSGVISVQAQVGFTREEVSDAVAFFKKAPTKPVP